MKFFYLSGIQQAKLVMKTILFFSAVLLSHSIHAQVKIGNNPTTIDPASLLELETTNQGFVLPRIAVTAVTGFAPLVSSPLAGTLVYSTSAPTGGSGIGLYYWDGSKWNFVQNGVPNATDWLLTGNSGTTAGTNFIGTTNPVDFVTKTNAIERMRVFSGGGIGIGTSTQLASALVSLQAGTGNAFLSTDNNTNWQAASTSGYEFFLTPRGSDNVTYLNYGSVGFNIRNNSSISTMFFQNNGFVGVGTTNPTSLLHLKSQTGNAGFETIDVTTTTQQAGIILAGAGTTKSNIYYDPTTATYGTNGALIFNNVGGTSPNSVFNPSGGNLGIATNSPASTLDDRGSFGAQYNNQTATAYTLTASDYCVIYSGAANATYTLPANAGAGLANYKGRQYYIKNYSAYYVTAAANGSELIDGASTVTIVPYGTLMIVSTGTTTGTTWNVLINTTSAWNKQIFTYTGSDQVFIVPPGITSVIVKAWGAGGGGGFSEGVIALGAGNGISAGGSGGYVSGTLAVTPGQNLLIQVGQGGTSFSSTASQYYYGGGADGGASLSGYASAGAGGGASGIYNFSGTTTYVLAGGGGGGGTVSKAGYGGAGGSTTAGAGGLGATITAAGAGTPTAGGGAGAGGINGQAGDVAGVGTGGLGATPTTAFTAAGNDAAGGGAAAVIMAAAAVHARTIAPPKPAAAAAVHLTWLFYLP